MSLQRQGSSSNTGLSQGWLWGGIAVVVTWLVLDNMKDIVRYIRISTM